MIGLIIGIGMSMLSMAIPAMGVCLGWHAGKGIVHLLGKLWKRLGK